MFSDKTVHLLYYRFNNGCLVGLYKSTLCDETRWLLVSEIRASRKVSLAYDNVTTTALL